MATPKYKVSKTKRNTRRAHHALSTRKVGYCANCNEPKLPHYVCASCGHYNGKQVMEPTRASTDFEGEDFSVDD